MTGAQVIAHNIFIPIGELSAEAQEARNKDYRRIREHNTRKSSHLQTTEDLVHTLLVSSDPVIASLMPSSRIKIVELPSGVIQLLKRDDSLLEE